MRIVVFTALGDFERTPWWPILTSTPSAERILICRRAISLTPKQAVRRFFRNVVKHGVLFIPYRVGLLAAQLVRRPFRRPLPQLAEPALPVEEFVTTDLHAPQTIERVRVFGADLGVSIGAPILRSSLFRLPRRGTINLHLGKVPDFRGAPPGFWELVAGAHSVGATVHWMDEGLDTGAILSEATAPIYSKDSWEDVQERATELGTRVLGKALNDLAHGDASAIPQAEGGRTHRSPTLGQRMALARRLAARRLRERLTARHVAKATAMLVALYVYRPVRDLLRTARRRHPVRIFNFHRVTSLCRDGMTVTPRQFTEQIDYLVRHHEIVTLEKGLEMIRSGARLSSPVAVLTFDDAYRSVFEVARPALAARGIHATCFVSTDLVGTTARFLHDQENPVRDFLDVMSWEELAHLRDDGWSLGTHTASHVRLSTCAEPTLQHEIMEPQRAFNARLGTEARVLAFPFGLTDDINDRALDVARAAGHTAVLADYDGENETGSSSFVLGRYDIGGDHPPVAWKALAHGVDLSRWRWVWTA